MAEDLQQLDHMFILGVSCETNEKTAMQDIGALWSKAAETGILGHSPSAWAVYDRYTVDGSRYTCRVTVGRAAKAGELVPPGHALVEVPSQRHWRLSTDGSLAAVQQSWARVWTDWGAPRPRAFKADVERWEVGPDGRPSRADLYIGMES